ncbi:MAG: VWA domain-containing protein [Saprospiraceae bacterium]|nr:VWA domain-containing protein [Saprospiraceae bacterium]
MRYFKAFSQVIQVAVVCQLWLMGSVLSAQSFCTDCNACPNYSVRSNPIWNKTCESALRLTLVIDESRSIKDAGPSAIQAVRDGVLAFLQDLECTPVSVAVVEFSSTARKVIPTHIPVQDARDCMQSYFSGAGCRGQTYRPDGATNWQAALMLAKELPFSDLMLFFTDGVPTAWSNDPTNPEGSSDMCSSGTTTQPVELYNAVQVANAIKKSGTRIFTLGVGDVNVGQLRDLSGDVGFESTEAVPTSDYAVVRDFNQLESAWQKLSDNLCPLMISCVANQDPVHGNVVTIDVADDAQAPFTITYGAERITSPSEPIQIIDVEGGRYHFTVRDASSCAREITCEIDIPVFENEAPIIARCQPMEMECVSGNVPPSMSDMPVAMSAAELGASDDHTPLANLVVSYVDSGPFIQDCQYLFSRIYTVRDSRGQEASCTQQIVMYYDPLGPTIENVPTDVTISCDASFPAWPNVSAIDGCHGHVTIERSEAYIEQDCGYDVVRTFVARDPCGNVSEADYTIYVRDQTAPRLSAIPQDGARSCTSNAAPWPFVSAVDNCAGSLPVERSEQIVPKPCGYDIVRTFSAVDPCGNEIRESYIISIRDTEPPILEVPTDLTVGCGEDVPPPDYFVSDDCTTPSVRYDEVRIDYSECEYDLVRTWIASDTCGHNVTKTQTVKVVDREAPVIQPLHPMLQGVESGGTITHYGCEAPQMTLSDVAVSDDCCSAAVILDFSEKTLGLNLCKSFDHTRHLRCTFTAQDPSGKVSIFEFDLLMYDTTAPTITNVPESTTLGCDDALPSADQVQVVDDCPLSANALRFHQRSIPNPLNRSQSAIYRTWQVEDACGNRSDASQMIGRCGLDHRLVSGRVETFVWHDQDHDGKRKHQEAPIHGMSVYLHYVDESGALLLSDSSISDQDGMVRFGPLLPGVYQLRYASPDGFQPTKIYGNADEGPSSHVIPELSMTHEFFLHADSTVILSGGFCIADDGGEMTPDASGFVPHRDDRSRSKTDERVEQMGRSRTGKWTTNITMTPVPNPTHDVVQVRFVI